MLLLFFSKLYASDIKLIDTLMPSHITPWTPRQGFGSEQDEDPDTESVENENELKKIKEKYVDKFTTSKSARENKDNLQKSMHAHNMSSFPQDPQIGSFSADRNSLILESQAIIRLLQAKIPNYDVGKRINFAELLYYLASSSDQHMETREIVQVFYSEPVLRMIELIEKYVDVLSRNPANNPFHLNQARIYASELMEAYHMMKEADRSLHQKAILKLSEAIQRFFHYKIFFEKLTVNTTPKK